MFKRILFFIFISIDVLTYAQTNYTQTIRGQVTDKITSAGLPGVIVRLKNDSSKTKVTITDEKGNFKLDICI